MKEREESKTYKMHHSKGTMKIISAEDQDSTRRNLWRKCMNGCRRSTLLLGNFREEIARKTSKIRFSLGL